MVTIHSSKNDRKNVCSVSRIIQRLFDTMLQPSSTIQETRIRTGCAVIDSNRIPVIESKRTTVSNVGRRLPIHARKTPDRTTSSELPTQLLAQPASQSVCNQHRDTVLEPVRSEYPLQAMRNAAVFMTITVGLQIEMEAEIAIPNSVGGNRRSNQRCIDDIASPDDTHWSRHRIQSIRHGGIRECPQ